MSMSEEASLPVCPKWILINLPCVKQCRLQINCNDQIICVKLYYVIYMHKSRTLYFKKGVICSAIIMLQLHFGKFSGQFYKCWENLSLPH